MLTLKANLRINQKKSDNRRLRKNNKCPAIIYTNFQNPDLLIELNNNELQHPNIITQLHKKNIIKLIIHENSAFIVKIQDIQYHPFKKQIIHIDFIRIKHY